ncbi:MAG TPA: hypothetical protein VF593_06360 [Chthoniobacteraceae bacterium]|jgi:hypothetical protein
MKDRWHVAAVALAGLLLGLLFLQEPGFGDDLTYWSFAFDLHERGLIAWQKGSFHDLRWPVWGVCWMLQAIFGPGLLSYYGEPLLYLAAGAALAFCFGRKLTAPVPLAWACGIAFLFHPLLDTVCYRPMPDLSEGVLGAAVMLAWWQMMQPQTRLPAILYALLTGAGITVLEANRVTGMFIVPVLILCTLLFFPRRFGWLVLAGVFSAVLYAGECLFYKRLFNDWLHDLSANTGNKGAKGTEYPNAWTMPFRFFDTLWKGNPLAPVYCIFSAIGIWSAWKRRGVLGRVIVVWFGGLYLLYSCAPQSLWPYRPLVRDADRFLCAIVVPMALLAVLGLWEIARRLAEQRVAGKVVKHAEEIARSKFGPALVLVGSVALLTAATSRALFDPGFVPEMRRYLASVPDGTRIFSHKAMREIVHLVDASSGRRLVWNAPNAILHRKPELEAQAAGAAEFWYARKLVWLTTRKELEKQKHATQPPLGSYFDLPEREWTLTGLFAKGDTPDLIFYRRRKPDSPAPLILNSDAAEWQQLLPALPAKWARKSGTSTLQKDWNVPDNLLGRVGRIELNAASEQVEALTIRLRFFRGRGDEIAEYLLKPYLFPSGGKEFFALQIPANAESCQVQLKFAKSAEAVEFTSFRAVFEAN